MTARPSVDLVGSEHVADGPGRRWSEVRGSAVHAVAHPRGCGFRPSAATSESGRAPLTREATPGTVPARCWKGDKQGSGADRGPRVVAVRLARRGLPVDVRIDRNPKSSARVGVTSAAEEHHPLPGASATAGAGRGVRPASTFPPGQLTGANSPSSTLRMTHHHARRRDATPDTGSEPEAIGRRVPAHTAADGPGVS